MVVDGRNFYYSNGADLLDLMNLMSACGASDALNLDGGGSSALWTAQEGVGSHPSDNRRFDHEGERGVPNCIVVRR